MPDCMVFISSFTLGKRLAAPAWIPLYQDWAMAGSFARRNTEFFLLDEITSKYLAHEMRGRERIEKWQKQKGGEGKKGPVREVKDAWRRQTSFRANWKFQILKRICEWEVPFYNIPSKPFCYFQVEVSQTFFPPVNELNQVLCKAACFSHVVPVFCVRGALFSWHLTHLERDAARLLHLRGELHAPLRCGGGRVPREGSPRGARALKEGRHLLDVLHWSKSVRVWEKGVDKGGKADKRTWGGREKELWDMNVEPLASEMSWKL